MPSSEPDEGRRPKRLWLVLVSGAPWLWFAVRNTTGYADAVAVALPFMVVAGFALLGLAALAFRRFEPLVAALSLAVFGLVAVVAPRASQPSPVPVRPVLIAAANTFANNRQPSDAVKALEATDADVLVAVETTGTVRQDLVLTDSAHRFQALSGNLVVRSTFPVQPQPLPASLPSRRVMVVRVDAPVGPFLMFVVHAFNPLYESSFPDELDFVRHLRDAASHEPMPVVLAGDFNMSDRTLAYRTLDGAFRDAMRTGKGLAPETFDSGIWRFMFLRIDHIFVSRNWCADGPERFGVPGSDHEGVMAAVGPCPGT